MRIEHSQKRHLKGERTQKILDFLSEIHKLEVTVSRLQEPIQSSITQIALTQKSGISQRTVLTELDKQTKLLILILLHVELLMKRFSKL